MPQSQSSAPPPEYTRQDPAPSISSTLPATTSLSQSTHQTHFSQSTTTNPPNQESTRATSPTPSTQSKASTLLPTYAQTGSYKGFPSESAYLAALTEWAEEKKYLQPSEEGQTLSGFYGNKTVEDYAEAQRKDEEKKRRPIQGNGESGKQGFMGFLKKMAKKDEGGGH